MAVPNPTADVRQMIEVVKARHYEAKDQNGNAVCFCCMPERWPCSAIHLLEIVEAWSHFADYAVGKHGVPPLVMPVWTAILFGEARRMAGGE